MWSRLRRDRPARIREDDDALLAGYHRRRLSRGATAALYLVLALAAVGWGVAWGLLAPFRMMPLVAPLPLMALLIIWLLPQGDYAPTKALEPLFLAFMSALIIWPDYIAIALPHLPWITMRRIFAGPLALVLLISISVSATFRADLKARIGSAPLIWKLLAGFLVLQTVSLAFSESPAHSVNNYIVAQLNCTAIFVVACYLFTLPGFARRWASLYVLAAMVVCFVGLWEASLGVVPWSNGIPSFLRLDQEFAAKVLGGQVRAVLGIHRVQAVFTHPLGLAEMLGLAAPFALHMAISSGGRVMRILSAAYLPLGLTVILLTDSRLGMVAMLASMMFYGLFWGLLRWRANPRSLLAPSLVLAYPALMILTFAATFVVGALRRSIWGSGAEQASTASRIAQWELAIPKIASHPLGHGIGRAGAEVGYISPTGVGTLDSYYINILMDYGPLGFPVFFGMFIAAALMGAAILRRGKIEGELTMLLPCCVALLVFVIVKSVFSMEVNLPIAFMILGAVVGLVYRARSTATDAAAGPAPARP